MLIYLPVNDPDLVTCARDANGYRQHVLRVAEPYGIFVHGTDSGDLSGVTRNQTLYVLVHGRSSTSNQVGGITGTKKGWFGKTKQVVEFLNAVELAQRMVIDGLTRDLGDLRLMACWAGKAQKKKETPFAGQLCSALKEKGFWRIIVTGFTGAVLQSMSTRNLLIQTRGTGVKPGEAVTVDEGGNVPGVYNTQDRGQSLYDLMTAKQLNQVDTKTVWY
jgi:hypothetical protein